MHAPPRACLHARSRLGSRGRARFLCVCACRPQKQYQKLFKAIAPFCHRPADLKGGASASAFPMAPPPEHELDQARSQIGHTSRDLVCTQARERASGRVGHVPTHERSTHSALRTRRWSARSPADSSPP
eukprot:991299-Pleurochrysis_carterae.AAC.1